MFVFVLFLLILKSIKTKQKQAGHAVSSNNGCGLYSIEKPKRIKRVLDIKQYIFRGSTGEKLQIYIMIKAKTISLITFKWYPLVNLQPSINSNVSKHVLI